MSESSPSIYIAGSGKLAQELMNALAALAGDSIRPWQGTPKPLERCVVVHAGSGRELAQLVQFCEQSSSILLELATGTQLEHSPPNCPVVLCPNTNILMLKFMHMLERNGHLFAGYPTTLTESHQSSKTSVPGTAVSMARSLGLSPSSIQSLRDPSTQERELGFAAADLSRHAFHRIQISDGACQVQLEAKVVGEAPYARGVWSILDAALRHPLEHRIYPVAEFIENGWL
jgi:4-hydroxy-tetrahydrodipicolinate reductase